MSNSALQTVQQYQQLIGNGSDEWVNLVADDITFIGPVADEVHGKETYVKMSKGFYPLIKGYEPISSFEQGNRAVLEGIFTLQPPNGKAFSFAMAEVYEIENGQIHALRVYFDGEQMRKVMS